MFALAASLGASAQQAASTAAAFTAADYARAEKFMTYNTTPLVLHSGVRATWRSFVSSSCWTCRRISR